MKAPGLPASFCARLFSGQHLKCSQEDGGVTKKVLKQGSGHEMPEKGDEVFGECKACGLHAQLEFGCG